MTSNISLFKIMGQQTRRKVWLLVLSSIVQLLFGPTMMLYLLDNRMFYYNNEPATPLRFFEAASSYLHSFYAVMQIVILIVGAILVSIFGFQHLYSKRMTDLYHSTPVTRKKQFAAGYITGFLFWLLPCLLANLLTGIVVCAKINDAAYFGQIITYLVQLQLICLLSFWAVYHLCLLAVTISGNIFNTLINIAILGLAVIAAFTLINIYAYEYFVTFADFSLSFYDIGWLSPLTTPFQLFFTWGNQSPEIPLYVGTIFLSIVQGVLAYILYLKRPSELAERGTQSKIYTSISKWVVSVLAGLFGAWFIGSVVGKDATEMVWGIFIALVISLLTYGLLDMIYQVNFKAFFSHKLMLVLSPLCACLLFASFPGGFWHFDSYIAKQDNLEQAVVTPYYFTDESYRYLDANKELCSYDYSIEHPTITLTDGEVIHALLADGVASTEGYAKSMSVKVKRKFGGEYYRSYTLSQEGIKLLEEYLQSEEYIHASYPASCGDFPTPEGLTVSSGLFDSSSAAYDIYTEAEIRRLMDAYTADFWEHYSVREMSQSIEIADIRLSYKAHKYQQVYLSIPSTYARTIEILEEHAPLNLKYSPDQQDEFVPSEDLEEDLANYLKQLTEEELADMLVLGYYSTYTSADPLYVYVGEITDDSNHRYSNCYISVENLP